MGCSELRIPPPRAFAQDWCAGFPPLYRPLAWICPEPWRMDIFCRGTSRIHDTTPAAQPVYCMSSTTQTRSLFRSTSRFMGGFDHNDPKPCDSERVALKPQSRLQIPGNFPEETLNPKPEKLKPPLESLRALKHQESCGCLGPERPSYCPSSCGVNATT